MSKIAIISNGYMWFPCEAGPSRFFYIANQFVKAGHEVEVITVDFQHFKKEKRDIETIEKQNYPFKITFIKTPPYKKNIDVRRVYSNHIVRKRIVDYLQDKMYDAVYCSIPANDIAAAVSNWCKAHAVPFVIDVEDLWPEAMSMVIKNEKIRNFLLKKMLFDAELAYANASGVIGTSQDYTMRAFKNRLDDIPHKTVFVGCDIDQFDSGVREFCHSIDKEDDEFWITYAGSIGTSYDIKTLIDAARLLLENEKNEANHSINKIKIQILGTGPLKEELEEYSDGLQCSNVKFWGYVPYPKMAAVLQKSDVLLNSFVKGAPQSIVNKVGDYLAAGKPMINSLENSVFCNMIEEATIGINIEPGKESVLADAIVRLYNDKESVTQLGKNAREYAEIFFDRKKSYQEIVDLVEGIIQSADK